MNPQIPPGGKDFKTGEWKGVDKMIMNGDLIVRIGITTGGSDPNYLEAFDWTSHLGDEFIVITTRRPKVSLLTKIYILIEILYLQYVNSYWNLTSAFRPLVWVTTLCSFAAFAVVFYAINEVFFM